MEYAGEIDRLIKNFIKDLKAMNYFPPYLINKKSNFQPDKDSVLYSGPFWEHEEIEAALTSLLKSKWSSSGEKVFLFERQFSKKFNVKHSAMVNSGSSANLVMIAALKKFYDWKDGDEIIISVVGFPTTLSAITLNGLTPVFVDIDFMDLNWDISEIQKKITTRTKAVFSSPVLGNVFNLELLLELCNDNRILHILDNCDSLGSKWKNRYLNEYAVASSTSFYPAHHISTLEGGMVSSNIEEIIKIVKSISGWGRACYCMGKQNLLPNGTCGKRFDYWIEDCDFVVDHKYVFNNIGYNLKALDIQGAIGSAQLLKIDEIIRIRRENYDEISLEIGKIPGVRVIKEHTESITSWFGIPIFCETKELKQNLVEFLEKNRIQTRNYFAGNILQQPAYKILGNYLDYPNATKVLEHVFFLGTSPTISKSMIDYVKSVIRNFNIIFFK